MWIEISRLDETTGHEGMQEPPSGGKRKRTGRVEHHVTGAEAGKSLVEAGGACPAVGRVWTDVDQGVGAGLQGAVRTGVLLFPFGPPVLEPDFHLGFGQTQGQGEVQSLAHGQVPS